jgi:hypothetical protein
VTHISEKEQVPSKYISSSAWLEKGGFLGGVMWDTPGKIQLATANFYGTSWHLHAVATC